MPFLVHFQLAVRLGGRASLSWKVVKALVKVHDGFDQMLVEANGRAVLSINSFQVFCIQFIFNFAIK